MSDRRDAAAATLRRHGVAPESLAAGEVTERLAAVVAGPEGTAVVRALAEFPSPAVAALLAALEPRAPDRATRKEVRRALYRLAQSGVPRPERPAAPAPAPAPEPEPEALLTAFAGDGDRIAWLVRPLADGGSFVVYAHLNEPRGLLALTAGEIGRKRLRAVRKSLEGETGFGLVRADWRTVDALLVEAHERAGAGDPERDYLRVRRRVTADPPAPPAEPVSARVAPVGADEAPALAADPARLLAEPELLTWVPAPEALEPFVEEIGRARESPLVLSPAAEQDRAAEILARAARAFAPPDVLARRLEGTAWVLAETGRTERAREALAAATLLRSRPEARGEVPLVVALVRRALGVLLASDAAHQEGSLIVTPGAFLRDRASSRPRHTRG